MPKLYLKASGGNKFEWVETTEKASSDAKASMKVTLKQFQCAKLEQAHRRSPEVEPGWVISIEVVELFPSEPGSSGTKGS